MSSMITKSSSLPRAYIGAHRNRQYLNNNTASSSVLNDYFPLTATSSKSFQLKPNNDLSNTEITNALQTQQEERASVKYLSPERQLHLQQEQKAKGFLPSSSSPPSSSSLLFLSPTTRNVTPPSDYEYSSSSASPPSFPKAQQYSHQPSSLHYEPHSYELPGSTEDKNKTSFSFDKFERPKSKPLLTSNQYFDLSDVLEENSLFSSTYSLSDTIVDNTDENNQSHLLTSTPILPSHSSYHHRTANTNHFSSLSTDNNNSYKPLPLTLDSNDEHSSTISTIGLVTDLQHKADVCQLDNMSSLSSSLLGTTTRTQPYDQRISDQGNKYIIQLTTDEFQENDFILTPRYSLHQLIIEAKHREEDSNGGYVHRELRKIFNIPKHIDLSQHAFTYNTQTRELTIEIPYLQNDSSLNSPIRNTTDSLNYSSGKFDRNNGDNHLPMTSIRSDYQNDSNNTSGIGTTATDSTLMRSSNTAVAPIYESSFGKTKPFDFDLFHRSAFRPQIVRTTSDNNNTNEKKLLMSLDLSDYQAEDIKVSIKDRELIVKAERKIETDTRKSRTSFFQSTSLPPQADIENLRSNFDNGKLIIEAPYLEQKNTSIKSTSSINQGTPW